MLGSVDLLRLLDWPMIQPQDDVAVVAIIGKVRARDGHGFIGVIGEDGEGASSVKSNALDVVGVDA